MGTDDELSAELDRFRDPPANEYGNVPFWWWDGDRLSKERITDQLETLKERGVEAVCFEQKFPHGPPQGPQAPYFTEEWWEYMEHAVAECDRLGMSLWIHDLTYHHSPPSWKRYWQSYVEDEIDEHPEFQGHVLDRTGRDVAPGETATLELPAEFTPVSVAAYPVADDGTLSIDEAVELDVDAAREPDRERIVEWTAPDGDDREWHVAAVGYRPEGLCRTTRDVVDRIIDFHYEEYVDRLGDALGDPIVGTFQDELYILQGTIPCDDRLLARYRAEWDEEPAPRLIALFENCGPETRAIRARYHDVVVTMLEENWFEPLYEWHERRGLRFAHDNWGRNDLTEHASEYGDYVRTMRWFQEPGYDDGGAFEGVGTRNFFDGKLAASIAACYNRDRVWGELLHTTGWGFPLDLHFAAIAENACYGLNRYNKHGLYYATLGGWYEHAPPDTHFRQPYWEQADAFNDAVTRLMYLCSRGDPVVDIAMLYPITSVQSHRLAGDEPDVDGPGGHHQVEFESEADAIDERTREIAQRIYTDVADLLFVDPETLDDGGVSDGRLAFASQEAGAFVIGPTTTVRRSVLETAAELVEDGGLVVSFGRLPTATVEGGADDEQLEPLLERIFGDGLERWRDGAGDGPIVAEREGGGVGILADDVADDLVSVLDRYVDRDVRAPADVYHTHRRAGDRDIYLLLNTRDEARTERIDLRATGRIERWDVQSGEVEPIYEVERTDGYASLELEFAPHEFHLLVVDGARDADAAVADTSLAAVERIDTDATDDDRIVVEGRTASPGRDDATLVVDGQRYVGESDPVTVPDPIPLEKDWTFEVEPTLSNEWGDHRYPASDETIGVEVREFEHRAEGDGEDGLEEGWADHETGTDDWRTVRWSYGQYLWRRTADADAADVATPEVAPDDWVPYEFSTLIGKPGTHPDDHGLDGIVSDDFLVAPDGEEPVHFWTTVQVGGEETVVCHYGTGIEELRIDGEPIAGLASDGDAIELEVSGGTVPVQVVVEPGTETHVAFESPPAEAGERDMSYVPRLRWFNDGSASDDDGIIIDAPTYTDDDALPFAARPWADGRVDWFRFEAPVGTTALTLPVSGAVRVWIDGEERSIHGDRVDLDSRLADPATVVLRSVDDSNAYGGARWTGPVRVETEPVSVETGDWCELGLADYSGVGVYRTTVELPAFDADDRVVLELGDVGVSAAVRVDGEPIGTTFAAPHEIDLTDAASPGAVDLEIRVANTIANHFATETPTRYVYEGQRRSGLFAPVRLRVERGVTIDAEPADR